MNESLFESVFRKNLQPCLLISSSNGYHTVVCASDVFFEVFCLTAAEVVNAPAIKTIKSLGAKFEGLDQPFEDKIEHLLNVTSKQLFPVNISSKNTAHPQKFYELVAEPLRQGDGLYLLLTFIDTDKSATNKNLNRQNSLLIEEQNKHLRLFETFTNTGYWELNIATGELYWSEQLFIISGLEPFCVKPTLELAINQTHPDDREAGIRDFNQAIVNGTPYQTQMRIIRPDGEIHHVISHGAGLKDDNGNIIKIFGLLQDVTEIVQLSNQLTETIKNLEQKTSLIQTVFENIPVGIAVTDYETLEIEFFNNRFSKIYGWDESVIKNLDVFMKSVYPDEHYREHIEALIIAGTNSNLPEQMRWQNLHITTATGEKRIVNAAYIPLKEHNRGVSTVNDVTQLEIKTKELEEANVRYQYVTKATSDAIWDWDIVNKKIYWGDGYEALFGYRTYGTEDDTNLFNSNIHPEDVDATVEGLRNVLSGTGNYWSHDYRYKKVNGEYAFVTDKGFVIRNAEGVAIRAVGAMQDVTLIKKEQEHLKLLESVINNTNDAIVICEAAPVDEPGPRIIFANKSFYRNTNYTEEEIIGTTPRILKGPLTDESSSQQIRNSLNNLLPYEGTILNYKKNGESFWNNLSIKPIANEKGKFTHWISVQRDVTENVKARQKLVTANRLYAFTARLNRFILEAEDEQAIYKEACHAALEAGHFEIAMIGLFNADKALVPVEYYGLKKEDTNKAINLFNESDINLFELIEYGKPKIFNSVPDLPPNACCNLFAAGYPVGSCIKLPIFKGGIVIGILNLYSSELNYFEEEEIAILTRASLDISTTLEVIEKDRQRTAAELQLKNRSEQLSQAQEIAHIGNWSFDLNTQTIEWSDEACRIYGLAPGNNKISFETFKSFLDSESISHFLHEVTAALKKISDFVISHKIHRADGSIRYLVTYASITLNSNNTPIGLYGLCHDITDYKLAELALISSKEALADIVAFNESLISASPMGICSYNAITGNCKLANQAYADAIGGTVASALKQNFRKISSWRNTALLHDAEDTLLNGTFHTNQIYITTTFNKKVWLDYTFLRFYDNDTPHLLLLLHDVTERKEAEIKLLETQKKYRQIVETTQDGIYMLDEKNCITYANSRFIKLLEYSENELYGKNLNDFREQNNTKEIQTVFEEIINGSASKLDHHYVAKSGKKVHVNVSATTIRNEDGMYAGLLAIVTDLTEKERLEALFEKASKLARIGSWEVDLLTNSVYFSDITREIHEVDEYFVPDLEKGIGFYKKGKDRDTIKRVIECGIENGTKWDEELVIITGKGKEKWIRAIGEVELSQGKAIKLFGSFQDIDVRKKAQLEVLKVLEEKNDILESIDDAFFALDDKWVVTYWNRQAEKVLNTKREKVIGKNLLQVFEQEAQGPFYQHYQRSLETNLVVDFEAFHNLTGKWLGVTCYPSAKGLSIYIKDITQRKKVEKQLTSERTLLRTLIDNLPDTIYYKDEQARKLISNKVDYTLLGAKTEAEVLGKTDPEIACLKNGFDGYQHDLEILTSGIAQIDREEKFTNPNGEEIWLSTSKFPVRNDKNEIIGLLGIGKDITLKKQSLMELNKLNEQLEQNIKQLQYSNHELEQFAYVASHDLQEPLRMITSFLTQIEKKYNAILDDRGRQYIHFAVDGAKRMRQIILDLLEYSRTGRMDVNKEPVDLNKIIEETILLHNKTITREKASITVEKMPVIVAAATPIRQVFQNLIGNSLKYIRSDVHPEIKITCSETMYVWQFAIADNGIGISSEYFDKIFVIFQRLHSREAYSGTGIGLAITKRIIENLGGKIWVESNLDSGSCFFFTIPKTTKNEKY